MKQFHYVVLDRFTRFSGTFASEPYEVGWADEAIAFIRIHELDEKALVSASVQISMDGIVWLEEGTAFTPMGTTGDYFVRVRHFGNWLRLQGTVSDGATCKATLSLALKG